MRFERGPSVIDATRRFRWAQQAQPTLHRYGGQCPPDIARFSKGPIMAKKAAAAQTTAAQAHTGQAATAQAHTAQANAAQVFSPRPEFSARAVVNSMQQYEALWQRAKDDPDGFWGELASEELHWFKPFDKVLDWKEPNAKWFVGGKMNVSYNCLDRHLTTPRRNKAAIIWEGEPGDTRTLTYQQLHREVCKFANVLKTLGIKTGDSRHDLHADDPRAGHRHAGLCPDRRDALGHLRRLLRRRHRRPQQRRQAPRSSSPPTAAGGAARKCRSRPTSMRPSRNRPPSRSASCCGAAATT